MRQFVVIGLSSFGYHVATQLAKNGCEVMVIDIDKEKIQEIKDYVHEAIVADGSDKETLKSLGLEKADGVIVSLGSDMSASILITLYLKELGIKEVIVKVLNEDHGKIVSQIGASTIIFPEKDMAIRLGDTLSSANVLDQLELAPGYSLLELGPPKPFIGKSIKELRIRSEYNIQIIAIRELVPEKFNMIPSPDFVIKDSDILLVLGKDEDIEKIKKL